MWLQSFVIMYHTDSFSSAWRNFMFSSLFELALLPIKYITTKFLICAEVQRFGSRDHITFDRFHLVNAVHCAFHLYKAIFKITLLANQKSVISFITWVLPKLMIDIAKFCVRMYDWRAEIVVGRQLSPYTDDGDAGAGAAKQHGETSATDGGDGGRTEDAHWWASPWTHYLIEKFVGTDVLARRGKVCFEQSLQISATSIAAVQYAFFLIYLSMVGQMSPSSALANNMLIFPFLAGTVLDGDTMQQQFAFIAVSWLAEVVLYCTIDSISHKYFKLAPTYVVACHLQQYPRFSRTVIVLAAHITSDVYLGMVLVTLAIAR